MKNLTKKEKLFFVNESIKAWLLDDDKREELAKDFEWYLDIHLTQQSRAYLDQFKREYENLWYEKKNYWYAYELAKRQINKKIKDIVKYNNFTL